MLKRILIVLVVLVVVLGLAYVVRARGSNDRAEADAEPLFVPVIVTPSVQIANGQLLLYKATNVSEGVRAFRLMLYDEQDSVPTLYKDFSRIGSGQTVSYVYEPPKAELTLGAITIEAPKSVRAVFAPQPAGDPGAMRSIVATVQIMRVQAAGKDGGAAVLDAPIIVPIEHCNFEPRGFVPYTGGRWYWNCAPEMYPINERWRQAGQGNAGGGGGGGRGGAQGGRGGGGRAGGQGSGRGAGQPNTGSTGGTQ